MITSVFSDYVPLTLLDVVQRSKKPAPWSEGDKIPWDDPAFSERMLDEHLTQAHDLASRRAARIEIQVQWIHSHLLQRENAKILDLGCGPGLYLTRLASLGHSCTGIDIAPAAIAYARERIQAEKLPCTVQQADIRTAAYGGGYDLAMLLYGECNVFRPKDLESILAKSFAALTPGGQLLLESHTYEMIRKTGSSPGDWRTSTGGLLSPGPHLVLHENFWDEDLRVATERYYVVDAVTATTTRFAQSIQAYTDGELEAMLEELGFGNVLFLPSLGETSIHVEEGLQAVVATKP